MNALLTTSLRISPMPRGLLWLRLALALLWLLPDAIQAQTGAPPTVTIQSPVDASRIYSSRLSVSGIASDPNGLALDPNLVVVIQDVSTNLFWDGTGWVASLPVLTAPLTGNAWHYNGALPTVNAGEVAAFAISAFVSNSAGTVSALVSRQNLIAVIVVGGGPIVQVVAPAHNSVVSGLTRIAGIASDQTLAGFSPAVVSFTLFDADRGEYWNGTAWTTTQSVLTAPIANDSTWIVTDGLPTGPNARAGNFALSASVVNAAGVSSVPASGVTSILFRVDSSPPTVAFDGIVPGATVATLGYTLSGTVSDNVGISGVTLFIKRHADGLWWNGSTWAPATANATPHLTPQLGNGTFQRTGGVPQPGVTAASRLTDGDYTLYATAADTAGNLGYATVPFHVERETTPPTVTIGSIQPGSTVAALNAVSGTTTDNVGIEKVEVYLYRVADNKWWNGSFRATAVASVPSLPTLVINPGYVVSTALPQPGTNRDLRLINGDYELYAIATDTSENYAQVALSFRVEFVYHWTGETDNAWEVAGNWAPSDIPADNDIVQIDGGAYVNSSAPRAVRQLRMSGNATALGGFSLLINGPGGGSKWSGGEIRGSLAIAPGASLEIDTTGVPRLSNASLVNAGTITLTGDLTANPNARLSGSSSSIENAGIFALARDGQVFENAYLGPVFTNYGLLVKSAGTGVTDFGSFRFVNDSGYVQSNSGILRFTDQVSLVNAGGITGVGAVRFAANNASIAGFVYVYGNLEFASGSAGFNAATLNISAPGRVRLLGGALGGSVTIAAGRLEIDTTGNPACDRLTLTNHGVVAIVGDPLNGALQGSESEFVNATDGRVEFARPGTIFANAYLRPRVTNRGTIAVTATSGLTDFGDWDLNGGANGVLDLAAGGSLRLQGSVGFGADSQVNGAGLLRLESGNLTVHGRLTAAAPVELRSGVLNGADGAEIATSGAGSFTWNGGALTGLIGVAAGSVWTIDTTSTPGLSASLNNHGRIIITGSASAGTLDGSSASIFNFADGRIEIARDGDIFRNAYITPQVGNIGTIVKTAGSGTANFGSFPLLNGTGGIVAADVGTLRFTDYVSFGQDSQLAGNAAVRFTSNQLHLTGRVLVAGQAELASGTLTGDTPTAEIATIGSGRFLWSGGAVAGTLGISVGSRLDIDTTNNPYLAGCTLNNSGLIAIGGTPAGGLLYGSSATLNNLPGGRIEFDRDGAIFHNDYITPVVNNRGTIAKAAGTGTTDFGDFVLVHATGGILQADTGTLRLNGNASFAQDSSFAGAGVVHLESNNLTLTGRLLVSGNTRFTGGRIDGGDNAQIATLPGGQFLWTGGGITGALTIPVGSRLDVDTTAGPGLGGTIYNAGRLVIDGSPISGAFYASGSTINNLATGSLEFVRDGVIFQNTYITPYVNNAGLITKTAGTVADFGSFVLTNSGRIDVPAGKALQFTSQVSLQNGSVIGGGGLVQLVTHNAVLAGPTSIDAGSTLELGVASNARLSGNGLPQCSIAGPGTFRWSRGGIDGSLAFAPSSNVVWDTTNGIYVSGAVTLAGNTSLIGTAPLYGSNAAIEILPGGVLQIPASIAIVNDYITPVFQNDGTIRLGSGATLTSDWVFTQTATGTVEIQLAGSGAGQFSKVQLSQRVTLAGQVKVTRVNGYSPPKDTSFTVLTFPSRNGAFTSAVGLGLGNGLQLSPVITDNSVTLNTVVSPFGNWQAAKFGVDAGNPAIAGPLATPAGDGIPNALKYAFNLDPFTDGSTRLPKAGLVVDPVTGLKHLGITFRRLIGATDPIYVPRVSASLTGAWDATGTQVEQFGSASPNGDGTETVTFRLMTPLQPGTQRFLDVEVDYL